MPDIFDDAEKSLKEEPPPNLTPDYEVALAAHNEASQRYHAAEAGHRDGRLTDDELWAARREYHRAKGEFDGAHTRQQQAQSRPSQTMPQKENPFDVAERDYAPERDARIKSIYADRKMSAVDKIKQLDQLDPDFKSLSIPEKVTKIMGAMYPSAIREPTSGEQWKTTGLEAAQGLLTAPLHDVATAADVAIRQLPGSPRITQSPTVKQFITPQPTPAGRAGFEVGEMAPYLIPIGGEIKGAGLIPKVLRTGRAALQGGLISGAQTGTKEGAETGALTGGALGAAGELLTGAGRSLYSAALGKIKNRAERAAIIERGMRGVPVAEKALTPGMRSPMQVLQDEVNANKPKIEALMKDPLYANRSISVPDLLKPVDQLINDVQKASPSLANQLAAARQDWLNALGGSPATTVGDAQALKESIDKVLGRKPFETPELGPLKEAFRSTRGAARAGIEQAIPERLVQYGGQTVHDINQVMHIDLELKKAIFAAVNRKPNLLWEIAPIALGVGAGAVLDQLDAKKYPQVSEAARIIGAIGTFVKLAQRNPGALSRTGIFLGRIGALTPALTPLLRGDVTPEASPSPATATPSASLNRPQPARTTAAAPTTARERDLYTPGIPYEKRRTRSLPERAMGGTPATERAVAEGPPETHIQPANPARASASARSQAGETIESRLRNRPDFTAQMQQASQGKRYVTPELLKTISILESDGQPNPKHQANWKGEEGLMQIIPSNWKSLGIHNVAEARDPQKSINGAAQMLEQLGRRYHGDLRLMIAAYNGGTKRVDRYQRGEGPLLPITEGYVNHALRLLGQRELAKR